MDRDVDHKLLAMYDMMQDGDHTMHGLRVDVDKNTHAIEDACEDLDSHCKDQSMHPKYKAVKSNPGNPGTASKIKEYKLQITLVVVSTVSAIVLLFIGANGG